MGIDFGLRHIGLAFGQTVSGTARALGSISVKKGKVDWEDFNKYIQIWEPDAFVLGLPLHMDGSKQHFHPQLVYFKKCLERQYGLQVFWSDEQLSTVEARDILYQDKGKRGLTKKNIDAVSACIILERWLACNR